MTTKNESATGLSVPAEDHDMQPGEPAPVNRRARPRWWAFAVAPLAAALAFGQVAPLQIIPLALGYSPDHNVILHMKGPTDVLQTDLIFQPGGTTGWHTHPGPVVVVVKSGALTEIHRNGCMTVHLAGSGFFEQADEVHNVINHTGVVTEVYATFLSPSGSQPLIPASDPHETCHSHDR